MPGYLALLALGLLVFAGVLALAAFPPFFGAAFFAIVGISR
jgi:hypothetical protein